MIERVALTIGYAVIVYAALYLFFLTSTVSLMLLAEFTDLLLIQVEHFAGWDGHEDVEEARERGDRIEYVARVLVGTRDELRRLDRWYDKTVIRRVSRFFP